MSAGHGVQGSMVVGRQALRSGVGGRRATRPPRSALPYCAALDGLRALSVLAVVLYHWKVPGFDGGYLGVEVFFVISGYLITALLIGEHSRSGTIGLRGSGCGVPEGCCRQSLGC